MDESNYQDDLSKEVSLSKHLDLIYLKVFKSSNFSTIRNHNVDNQHRGVDLTLTDGSRKFYVDEKAQLDYLNKSLPTFAFEISYLKHDSWYKGWLLDTMKITDIYFLITGIYTEQDDNLTSGLKRVKITGVYRKKLIKLLVSKGLTESRLYEIENQIRTTGNHGRIPVRGLNPATEGFMYFSKKNKSEQPINLVLRLKFLTTNLTGKILFSL